LIKHLKGFGNLTNNEQQSDREEEVKINQALTLPATKHTHHWEVPDSPFRDLYREKIPSLLALTRYIPKQPRILNAFLDIFYSL
jgi:hypothetical protein